MTKPFLMNFSKKEINLNDIGGDIDFRTNMKNIFGIENLNLNNNQETVLVFSRIHDSEADLVCVELAKKGVNYIRLNADYFPEKYKFTYKQDNNKDMELLLKYQDEEINFKNISVIWYRHFDYEAFDFHTNDKITLQYLKKEWENFLISIALVTECVWINNPIAVRNATKMMQLKVANQIGFDIPNTLITNDDSSVRELLKEEKRVIAKVIDSHHVEYEPGKLFTTHAHILNKSEDLEYIDNIHAAPVTFQPFVENNKEVRVTVVGKEIFTSLLTNRPEDYDWHNKPIQEMKLAAYEIDEKTKEKCLKLLKKLGLEYGAIDLLLVDDKEYFLEVNTIGDWRWVEFSSGQDIGSAVVRHLMSYLEVKDEIKNY